MQGITCWAVYSEFNYSRAMALGKYLLECWEPSERSSSWREGLSTLYTRSEGRSLDIKRVYMYHSMYRILPLLSK